MKYFVFFFLPSFTVLGQSFLTGQAARITVGQTTFTSQDTGSPSQYQLGGVGGVAFANNTLFVADSNHIQATPSDNRVLIYSNVSQFIYSPTADIPQGLRCPVCFGVPALPGGASLVLGQPDFVTITSNTSGISYPITGATNGSPIVLGVSNTTGVTLGSIVSVSGVAGDTAANGTWQVAGVTPTSVTLAGTTGNGNYTGGGLLSVPQVSALGMQNPTAVASNGNILVVADTDNNRVLIWNSIPATNDAPPDIVLGQVNFNTTQPAATSSSSLRGPEGVWIQGTRLFVADTGNHRVMVWNNIPTANNQPADYVLGEPNFTAAPPATASDVPPQANNLYSPVSVSSDGQRLFVADLAHNRVLIWNSIPAQTQQPADVVIGQPNMTSETQNNVLGTCVTNATDSDNNPTYPAGCTTFCPLDGIDSDNNPLYPQRCGLTLSYPRFVLSDGQRLFIADGGNDRVLVYNSIPTRNGQRADVILGQPDEFQDQVTDVSGTSGILSSSPNTIRTPLSLAWDGANLYVADPFDRRVLLFTLGSPVVPITGITNAASQNVYALGAVTFGGTITANDTITITIDGTAYKYTVVTNDTLITIIENITNLINGTGTNAGKPDPNVLATTNIVFSQMVLTSRIPGPNGNNITYTAVAAAASTSGTPTETAAAAGANLSGGTSAAQVAPGTLVTIMGSNLSDVPAKGVTAVPGSNGYYPNTIGGVEVYFDGIKAPLLFVSPTQINTQVPYEVSDASGISAVVRTVHNDGTVTNADAISVPIVLQNPGIFAGPGTDPRPVIAYHSSSNAIALVDLEGVISPGNVATLKIEERSYNYTVQSTDTLTTVRDALVVLINSNPDEKVTASPTSEYTRIVLTAKVPGPDGNGIAIGGTSSITSTTGAVSISTLGNAFTCCASEGGARVTQDNPAVPGEVITIYAAGLGLATLADGATFAGASGQVYQGSDFNVPETLVDNAQVGGKTANVLSAALKPGTLGMYEIKLQLDTSLPTNPNTQMYIAQDFFTSNIVTIPVVAPSQ